MGLFDSLESYSARIAFISNRSEHISYQRVLALAEEITSSIEPRTLVLVLCQNDLASVAAYIGLLRKRAIPLLLPFASDNSLSTALLKQYQVPFLFAPSEMEVPNASKIYSSENYSLFKMGTPHTLDVHKDLALLLSTSGSTGSPKLVRVSDKNLESNARAIINYLGITAKDRAITTMPMSYSYGLSIINSHLLAGASIVLTQATLMESSFWDQLKAAGVTNFNGVPYIYEMLKKLRFASMNVPSLCYMTQAGGRLLVETCREFAELCNKKSIKFFTMYGQTEATARMSYVPWELAQEKAGSIGLAIPGGSFHLENENNREILESEVEGELIYKGDNVTMGYATQLSDLAKGDDNQGTLRTGDLAKRDQQGFYYLTGRKTRFLKIFGNRISLDEMEHLVTKAGYQCACTGTDDQLKIWVEGFKGQAQLEKHITELTGLHPSGFSIIPIEHLPRNESGKVLYASLDQQLSICSKTS